MAPRITNWRKSTRSGNTSNCVEVGTTPAIVGIRDSKDPDGAVLVFRHNVWAEFIGGVQDGEFDLK